MAILQGEYSIGDLIRRSYPNPDGTPHPPLDPERVKVTATPDEFTRIGELPDTRHLEGHFTLHEGGIAGGSETLTIPPDRDLVRHIARKVEVQVPDEALIDWMSRGGK